MKFVFLFLKFFRQRNCPSIKTISQWLFEENEIGGWLIMQLYVMQIYHVLYGKLIQ